MVDVSSGCKLTISAASPAGRPWPIAYAKSAGVQRFALNLIGDRAYHSDPLDEELRNDGLEMIAPHRSNRTKPPTQEIGDG